MEGGNVLHALKKNDPSFVSFGEAYFSFVENGVIKGWKKHKRMTMNLLVPTGEIRFVLFDEREGSTTFQQYFSVTLSKKNYYRLTVPPLVWMAFQGRNKGENMLLNIASIPHDPEEAELRDLNSISYNW